MATGNTDFTLIVNVANEQPFTPGERIRVETGAYMGVIKAVSLAQQKADPADPQKVLRNNLCLEVVHNMSDPMTRPEYKEVTHKIFIYNPEAAAIKKGQPGYDDTTTRLTRQRMRTLLESIGAKPEQLDANDALPVQASVFNGVACFFNVVQPPAGEIDTKRSTAEKKVNKYAEVDFLTPKEFNKRRAAQAASDTSGASTAGTGVFTPQTTQPAVGGSLASLLGGAPNGATAATGTAAPKAANAPLQLG